MLHGIDDLSIEELQNQLLEIQKKIKEKEKESLIEKISASLRGRELLFIQEVQAIVEGKKSFEKAVRKERQPSAKPFKIGKTEVYLRQGKVFFGIQEIKHTRLDKNNTLRISKEGKGLPPKVSSLPPHIQKVVLALPQKHETPGSDPAPASDTEPPASAPAIQSPPNEPTSPEPESVPDTPLVVEPATMATPEGSPETPSEEFSTAPPAPVRKRKPGASKENPGAPESETPESTQGPDDAPPAPSKAKEAVVSLQESLF